MTRHAPIVSLMLSAGLAALAHGQAFNIDFGGSTYPKPSSAYGGAAGQAGFWNGDESTLRDIDGMLTSVNVGVNNGSRGHAESGAPGDEGLLMSSAYAMNNVGGTSWYTILGLRPGVYDLYLYGWGGAAKNRAGYTSFGVTVGGGTTSYGLVDYGRVWPGRQIEGKTYDAVRIQVNPNMYYVVIQVDGDGTTKSRFGIFNGLQIVPVPTPGAAMPLLGLGLWVTRRRRAT